MKAASKRKDLKLKFHGAVDHLDDSMHEYKVRMQCGRHCPVGYTAVLLCTLLSCAAAVIPSMHFT